MLEISILDFQFSDVEQHGERSEDTKEVEEEGARMPSGGWGVMFS